MIKTKAISRRKKKYNFVLIFFLLIIFGVIWFYRFQVANDRSSQETIEIRGIIWDEPSKFYSSRQFWLKGYLIETTIGQDLKAGDLVLLVGRPECQLIGKYQKRCLINYPDISVVKGFFWSNIVKVVIGLRKNFIASLERVLPSEPASLLTGIVWGNQGQFSKRFYDDMKSSGLLHVVVASGANVLSLVALLEKTGRFLGRRLVIILSLPLITGYGFIVGNDPPIVRAVLMSGLILLAQLFGRPAKGLRNLFLAGGVMTLFDPLIILDIGFQLSFGASLGILLFGRSFKKIFHWSDLATTLAAQTLTTPILAFHFGQLSPFSFISNALLLWLIEPLMLWGLGLTALGLISWSLAGIVGLLFWLPLQVFTWGSHFWAQILPNITISDRLASASLIVIPLAWLLPKLIKGKFNEQTV